MKPTFSVDTTQFTAAAKALFETDKRACVDFVNGQTLRVVIETVRQTKAADAAKIASVLGQTGNALRSVVARKGANKGKTVLRKGAAIIREDSFASRILGARFKETGSWGVKGNTMEDRVRNFIAGAVRSASFIRSGWIPARNKFFSIVRERPANATSVLGARKYGRDKGSGRPATFALTSKITAEAVNTALKGNIPNAPSPGGNPMPIAEAGLKKALSIVAADMMAKLAQRLERVNKKFQAR